MRDKEVGGLELDEKTLMGEGGSFQAAYVPTYLPSLIHHEFPSLCNPTHPPPQALTLTIVSGYGYGRCRKGDDHNT